MVETLGKVGPSVLVQHAPALVAKLEDSDWGVRESVVEALGNFLMFEEGADEAAREAAEAAHEEDKALDEGRKLPPGWKEAESATGEKMWVSEESGDVLYDFPRETEEQKMARRKKF